MALMTAEQRAARHKQVVAPVVAAKKVAASKPKRALVLVDPAIERMFLGATNHITASRVRSRSTETADARHQREARLYEGAVVEYDSRIWRVGLMNPMRCRLDPVTGALVTMSDPSSGRSFQSYGNSHSISPSSVLKEIDVRTLDESAIRRLLKLQSRADIESAGESSRHTRRAIERTTGEDDDELALLDDKEANGMATTQAQTAQTVSNVAGAPGANKAALAKAKLKAIAAKKNVTAANGPAKGEAKAKRGPAERTNNCMCGCGGKTAGFFVPGHDARYKGWMKKVARGEMTPEQLPNGIAANYAWKKTTDGKGKYTTKNYRGDANPAI